ncbi:CBS domain-containing protein [Streptomyces spinoverrucosus]|uniref:CBS domain-containing protein n=1 Tax=Streptomyces spinoverrucosus TaxID=284043 RepID=UPI0018C3EECF|nr:CBS domain-containing protein [Streptomyces spinoverrucosus]MBG0857403.1 CBS domain-containing protein [Streptomyces spinoverrucosus]
MRARDLAESYVSVSTESDAIEAVRLPVDRRLPGLVVTDCAGQPYAALPAGVIDEPHADRLCHALRGRTVADCLLVGRPFLPTADPDWTAVELAELMARSRSPLVAMVERPTGEPARLLGVVTATSLLEHLLKTV